MKACILSSVHLALDNRVFYREARSLQRAGYDVDLIAVHDRAEVKDGVHIVPLPRVPRQRRPLLWRRLIQLARTSQADIYHFHDPELLLATSWLHWRTGKPVIYDVHEANADFIRVKDYLPAWLRLPIAWAFGWLEPLLARLQSGLIFADDQIAATFAGVHRPKATLFNFPGREFIELGVLASREPADPEPIVLYLGGMERNRGAHLMIEAFHQVWQAMPQSRLLLVGHCMPSTLADEMRNRATALGIAHAVTMTGRLPFEQIGGYLQEAAVGWVPWQPVPKNQKNIPTKLFEYMAYGLPVVSSDLESTRPFVHDNVNGYLVPAEDPAAHAAAILRLLREPDQAARLGRAGQVLVQERWHWEAMEPRLLTLYQALLS